MATLISTTDYVLIATYLSNVRTLLDQVSPYLFDAADTIVKSDDFEPTIDLINPFYNTYLSQTSTLDSNAPYLNVVRALNNHVIRRGGYSNIDAFLETDGSKVPDNWADMSAEAGFTISPSNTL
jgi:hypothetical protein